jgi:hypothetical protein
MSGSQAGSSKDASLQGGNASGIRMSASIFSCCSATQLAVTGLLSLAKERASPGRTDSVWMCAASRYGCDSPDAGAGRRRAVLHNQIELWNQRVGAARARSNGSKCAATCGAACQRA